MANVSITSGAASVGSSGLLDPTANGRAPLVTITTSSPNNAPGATGTTSHEWNVKEYSYDADILTITDSFAVTIANPDGIYSQSIYIGDSVTFNVADPNSNSGQKNQKLVGIVTGLTFTDDPSSGSQIMIQGADLGWHLANNSGRLFYSLKSGTFQKLLNDSIDAAWNFQGIRTDNELNRRLNLGRRYAAQRLLGAPTQLMPVLVEPGETIADILIQYARRLLLLVNVSADGYLQFFQPNYKQDPVYIFRHHRSNETERARNNVKTAQLQQTIDGIYTDVVCVGQVAYSTPVANQDQPTAGKIRGKWTNAAALPFTRYLTFADGEQTTKKLATARAAWKAQRGQFDSWVYRITVAGHGQYDAQGNYNPYAPDTMCSVHDTVFGVDQKCYVSAVRYSRTLQGGTTTQLTLRLPNLLSAQY